ncbi:ABC transporter permease [Sphingomonas naphthae]|uniref:ABC transporter permease n=1 Tax=Sphingomonas naphthae TaxID=1813468 RepID=A0ABY7TIT0_9SPHN|nr:ABC transporter permease [Sphingomonas naphthae]WCT72716.1 ABC transporter permease [Sphingomonas naphthae]
MTRFLAAAWVIARRDYVASVFSRSFLFFLIGPLLPILAGVGTASLTAAGDRAADREVVAVLATGGEAKAIGDAAARLEGGLGQRRMPQLRILPPDRDVWRQTRALLGQREGAPIAVVAGGLAQPALFGTQAALDDLDGRIGLLLDVARERHKLGASAPPSPPLTRHAIVRAEPQNDRDGTRTIARTAQVVLFMLVLLLSGMLASNMIEEKSNKVIEILVAAVPVDAIFAGKLAAMLAMSLTGIAVWGATGALGMLLLSAGGFSGLPAPALGWPLFALLALLYFAASYLLVGGILLGIGAQASTPREVQTMTMPLTMGQALVFGLASAGAGQPDGPIGLAAAIFPFSSPFAMLSRAALLPGLWPHLLALAWQAAWLALIVTIGAGRFRRNVLQSGPAKPWRWAAWRRG